MLPPSPSLPLSVSPSSIFHMCLMCTGFVTWQQRYIHCMTAGREITFKNSLCLSLSLSLRFLIEGEINETWEKRNKEERERGFTNPDVMDQKSAIIVNSKWSVFLVSSLNRWQYWITLSFSSILLFLSFLSLPLSPTSLFSPVLCLYLWDGDAGPCRMMMSGEKDEIEENEKKGRWRFFPTVVSSFFSPLTLLRLEYSLTL